MDIVLIVVFANFIGLVFGFFIGICLGIAGDENE